MANKKLVEKTAARDGWEVYTITPRPYVIALPAKIGPARVFMAANLKRGLKKHLERERERLVAEIFEAIPEL